VIKGELRAAPNSIGGTIADCGSGDTLLTLISHSTKRRGSSAAGSSGMKSQPDSRGQRSRARPTATPPTV
jgi:hypothetical protein